MRTTLILDDELVEKAMELTGIQDMSTLLQAALSALVQREVARRSLELGGSDPTAKAAPRRRPKKWS